MDETVMGLANGMGNRNGLVCATIELNIIQGTFTPRQAGAVLSVVAPPSGTSNATASVYERPGK